MDKKTITSIAIESGAKGQLEASRFLTIYSFLCENPDFLSWRSKVKPDIHSYDGLRTLAQKFFTSRYRGDWPAEPTTIPDEAVSIVLQSVYGYSDIETERIKREHQHAMSAENIVGVLLERYIAQALEPYGWVWCAGDFVKAVDFIKFQGSERRWLAVQVKNRDNTENSSSSAIRHGRPIAIERWFRTFSKTGVDNWARFPEAEFRNSLSEQGFLNFIKEYFSSLRSPSNPIL